MSQLKDTRKQPCSSINTAKRTQFVARESASALKGFTIQFRIEGVERFGPEEFTQKAKPEVLRFMRDNRHTNTKMILSCEMVRYNEDLRPGCGAVSLPLGSVDLP